MSAADPFDRRSRSAVVEGIHRIDDGGVVAQVDPGSEPHVVTLTWRAPAGADAVPVARRAIEWAFAHGFVRVQTALSPRDAQALATARAVGLRQEGLARGAGQIHDAPADLLMLARLADDVDPALDPLPTIASGFPRITASAGLLIRDRADRVLLLQTSYKAAWEIPGGLMEADEGPQATVHREVREELGVELDVGDVLAIHFVGQSEDRPAQLALILDGGRLATGTPGSFTFPDGEIIAAHWCDRAGITQHASAALATRLTAILDAFVEGRLPGPTLVL